MMTLLAREMFAGAGTLNSATPGNFSGFLSGSLEKRVIGPRTSGIAAPGWSAAVPNTGTVDAYYDLTAGPGTAAANFGMIGGWFRFADFGGAVAPSHLSLIFAVYESAPAPPNYSFGVRQDGTTASYRVNAGDSLTGPVLSLNTWYYLVLAWQYNAGGTNGNYKLYYRTIGGSLIEAISVSDFYGGGIPKRVELTDNGYPGAYLWKGRAGSVGLYSIGSYADVAYDAGLIEPVEERHSWYVNPATGSDSNMGDTPGTAWKNCQKLADSIGNGTILGSNKPWVYAADNSSAASLNAQEWLAAVKAGTVVPFGDTVFFDTSAAWMPVTTAILPNVPGLRLTSANAGQADLRALKVISAGSWVKTAGRTTIYETTDTQSYCVLWEDRKWMNHPVGADFASVAAALDATAGSFWTDGVKLYYHAFNSGAPTAVLERSIPMTNHAIMFTTAIPGQVDNISIGGTAMVDYAANGSPANTGGYGISVSASFVRVSNCYTWYTSKHGIGSIDGASNQAVLIDGCRAEHGTLYTGAGGQTQFVVFAGSVVTGVRALLSGCVCHVNCGVIGSTAGVANPAIGDAFYSHITGGSPFASLEIENCDFSKNGIGCEISLAVRGTTLGETAPGGAMTTFDRCTFDRRLVRATSAGAVVRVRNSLLIPDRVDGSFISTAGEITIENCVVDAQVDGPTVYGVFSKSGTAALKFTMRNCVFAVKAGMGFGLVDSLSSTDIVLLDHNAYSLGTGGVLLVNYNGSNQTLAQCKTLGLDVAGIAPTNFGFVGGSYKPAGDSVLVGAGVDLGPLEDYTGTVFNPRNDIGAYEFDPSSVPPPSTSSKNVQRYKRRQMIAEAIQYNGSNFAEINVWCPNVQDLGGGQIKLNLPGGASATLGVNDWIVKAGNSFGPGRVQDYGYKPFGDVWESLS